MQSGEPDADDDLGTFERIPIEDDRVIDSEINVRFNARGCVDLVLHLLTNTAQSVETCIGAGLGKGEELWSQIKSLPSPK